jgi:hypothetical protein
VARWDSSDLLSRCRTEAQEPESGTTTTDAAWYTLLSDAQDTVYRLFAQHVPHVLVSAPTALTSSDGGYTYATPSNAFVYGFAEIRHGRAGPLLEAGADYSSTADFVWEGDSIRMPHGRTRTFGDGLYLRYIAPPAAVSASVEPTLTPDYARVLMVYEAVKQWAGQGALRDPSIWDAKYQRAAYGDGVDVGIIGTLKMQLANQGADGAHRGGVYWWRQDFSR